MLWKERQLECGDSGPGPSSALAHPVSLDKFRPVWPPSLPITQEGPGDLQGSFQHGQSVVLCKTGWDHTDSFRVESHLGKCQGFSQGKRTQKRTCAFLLSRGLAKSKVRSYQPSALS